METAVIVVALLTVVWMANTSRGTAERHGLGCGWLLWLVLFAIFVIAFPAALYSTLPADCPTIAINRAMGRCP